MAGDYIIYILLGYVFDNQPIGKRARMALYVCGAVGLFLHCYMTIVLSPEGQPINGLYKGYLNFPCVLYSSAIFVFVRYTDWSFLAESRLLSAALKMICECSLGIYLIHGWFVYYLVPYMGINTASIIYRTLGAVVVILCSMICTKAIKMTPCLRNIV